MTTGEASVTLDHGRLRYTLRFPRETVPHLGLWLNGGGFKGEHSLALAPSSGYYDNLAAPRLQRRGAAGPDARQPH